jgi:hypothetical protein
MSAEMGSNTEHGDGIVYVRLLGEGTLVFRPVPAKFLSSSTCVLAGEELLDERDEDWEFPPGTIVRTEKRLLSGELLHVAVTRIEPTR